MAKSMTGYGKAECLLDEGKITIEIRSLNGKNADIGIKTSLIPREKELEVRQFIAKELHRGNIDLFATFEQNASSGAKTINREIFWSITNKSPLCRTPSIMSVTTAAFFPQSSRCLM